MRASGTSIPVSQKFAVVGTGDSCFATGTSVIDLTGHERLTSIAVQTDP